MSDRYKGAILSPTAPTVTPQSAGGIYTSSQQLQYQGQGVWPQAVNNPLTNSLRFRSSASAYLNRTGGTSTSRRIHTFSFWTKSSVIGGTRTVISAGPDDSNREVIFIDSNKFTYQVKISNTFYDLETTQVFRDPAAWYHFVVAVDTTQATSSNRVKIYVNGSQITAFGTAVYPPQNADLFFDDSNGSVSYIGALRGYLGSFNYDGYFTEFNFIDGTALTPSSFGTTDAYGIWQPISYTGSYGTNGFYLPFTDNSALTTSSNVGLGKDFSGNGNYWVTNNISITAGSTYDSMKDVPTLTSATTANYCVINPLDQSRASFTTQNANLQFTATATNASCAMTIFPTSGKYYAEAIFTTGADTYYSVVGVLRAGTTAQWYDSGGGVYYTSQGAKMVDGSSAGGFGATWSTNQTIGIALDLDGGTVAFYKQNSLQGTITLPSSTTGWTFSLGDSHAGGGTVGSINCGQRPFTYTPPSGFYPLNTYNLPTPTILDGDQYMDATTYTGTGTTLAVTNSGSMQPDLVWIKARSAAAWHNLQDSNRGSGLILFSNRTEAEVNKVGTQQVQFNSNGFTLIGASPGVNDINESGVTFVGWQWRANAGTNVSNTQGTITSTVSANTTAGFSIATFTTPSSGTSSFGHGLGVTPSFVIVKGRSGGNWLCEHISTGSQYLILNGTGAAVTDSTVFNSTPTSTVVNLGTGFANANYVAYCFAQVAGYSAFGSYTGNGSSDGPFVYTGFRPRYIMIKRTDSSDDWIVMDSARNTYNVANSSLFPNGSFSETTDSNRQEDFLSNGFKIRSSPVYINASGGTYIYACFAESPFKISRAR